jgi:ABC-type sugar transport system ATPase subunit
MLTICDRIAIMRNGMIVEIFDKEDFDKEKIIAIMVGREVTKPQCAKRVISDKIVLSTEKLSSDKKITNLNLSLYEGEILGIAGIRGAGKTELLKLLCGAEKIKSGKIRIDGAVYTANNNRRKKRDQIVYIPSDRVNEGVFPLLSTRDNMRLDNIKETLRFGFIVQRLQRYIFQVFAKKLDVNVKFENTEIYKMSSGTQQKLMLARGLALKPKILLVDEPTKSIDVWAKNNIYEELIALAEQKTTIVAVFSETSEFIALCDRVLVLNQGRIDYELMKGEFDEERLVGIMLRGQGQKS